MSRPTPRIEPTQPGPPRRRLAAVTPGRVIALSLVAILASGLAINWTLADRADRQAAPPPAGAPDADPHTARPGGRPGPGGNGSVGPAPTDPGSPVGAQPAPAGPPGAPAMPGIPAQPDWLPNPPALPGAPGDLPGPAGGRPAPPGGSGTGECRTGAKLVPTCGVLWGVAPGAHTESRGVRALRDFEAKTGRSQAIFHAYHRGTGMLFPTPAELSLAREPGRPRILFINWKPEVANWAQIAKGDKKVDAFLDRLAAHIRRQHQQQFFFTVHHEAEDDVREKPGSGYTAGDYAAMYRHVISRLRARGVTNLVSVVVHMAYVPHTSQSWFARMYPGDDVVDWIGWDTYAYAEPGYGHGDFAELLNRRSARKPQWPGFYNWAAARHPDKPLMVAEWGVWHSARNPGHKAKFYRTVGEQIGRFPRVKALVHFDTPKNQDGRDSRVDSTPEALAAYRRLGALPIFQVQVSPPQP